MHQRCYNPNNPRYPRYGGRGITVCDRWHDAAVFIADNLTHWTKGLTLDRIDNDGAYSPENCRWVGYDVQARNTSLSRMLTYDGKTMCVVDWAKHLEISTSALFNRLNRHGWTVEKTLSAPVKKTGAPLRLEAFGKTDSLAGWARSSGLPRSAIQARLKRGWTVERAVSSPLL